MAMNEDAELIANEIVFGSSEKAHELWGEKTKELKLWECLALKGAVQKRIREYKQAQQ